MYNNKFQSINICNSRCKEINVEVTEMILTPLTCASVINEIIKCLVYQKSQIPYPYNWLKSVINRKRKSTENEAKPPNLTVERHYHVVSAAYDALENIMQNVNAEFRNYGDTIKQVLILFGSTVYSPKEVYSICINGLAKGHLEDNHLYSNNRNQHKILRNVVLAQEWTRMMETAIPPTNMFVLLQKDLNGSQSLDKVFFPLNRQYYSPSAKNIDMIIDLHYNEDVEHNCCNNLLIFEDFPGNNSNSITADSKNDNYSGCNTECDDSNCKQWFQANDVLKGFKECFIKDISATELW